MIALDIKAGKLFIGKMNFADLPYNYIITVHNDKGDKFSDTNLTGIKYQVVDKNETIVTGKFINCALALKQIFRRVNERVEETISLKNIGTQQVFIDGIELGFVTNITNRPEWRLCAIPFRVQLDGSVHGLYNGIVKRG